MATASEINEIIKLYVGYYNRAPDPEGLNFWIAAFDNGFSLDDMSVDFSTQAETLQNYPFFLNPSPSDEDYGSFIDSVYGNLFNREPDAAGRAFWVEKLGSGEFTVGQVISLIIEGATTSPDQDVVANKVAVGRDFYIKTNAEPEYPFDEDDIQAATDIQASVTEDPDTVTAATAQTDDYIASLNATTINLTSSTDTPGGGGNGVNTQGSDGDDTYVGTMFGTASSNDIIAAGGGDDTFDLRVTFNTSSTLRMEASDLENIIFTDRSSSGTNARLNIADFTGEQELTVQGTRSNSTLGFTNIDEGTMLRVVNSDGGARFQFKGDRDASTDDAFDLYVEDSGSEDSSAEFTITDGSSSSGDDSFEIANIVTGGSTGSFLDMPIPSLETLNVSGDQELFLENSDDGFQEIRVIDASEMTGGGLFVDASGAEENDLAFTGSDFDDGLYLSNNLWSDGSSLTLDGGDGMDTLAADNFNNLSATAINAATGFEVLRSMNHSSSLDADDFDINIFEFADQSSNSSLDIDQVTDEDLFIFDSDFSRTGELIDFDADTAGTALTFELRATSEDGGHIELRGTRNNNDDAAIDFSGSEISEVTIVSSGSNEDANVIRHQENGNNAYAFGNNSGPSNFNITGSQSLIITAEEGVNLTASDDERGFEEGVNLDASAFTGDLRVAGSGVGDAIEGGSGDDIIYGLGGSDVLTGNDGMDQFRFSDWRGTDEIRDFISGEDKVGLERVDFNNTNESTDGTTLDADDYVENLQNIANMTNAESDKLVEIQLGASQSQIEDTSASAQDAYLLVFNTSSGKGELWFDTDWSNSGSRTHTATFDNIESLEDLIGLSRTDFVEYAF